MGKEGTQVFGFDVSCAPAVGKEGTHMSVLIASLTRMAHQKYTLPSASVKLTAKPAVNPLTGLGLCCCRHCSVPSARATKLMAKALPSLDFQLTAKKVIANKIVAGFFADRTLTTKPLPSVKHVVAVSFGCRQNSRFQ